MRPQPCYFGCASGRKHHKTKSRRPRFQYPRQKFRAAAATCKKGRNSRSRGAAFRFPATLRISPFEHGTSRIAFRLRVSYKYGHMGGSSLSLGGQTGGTQQPIRAEEDGRSLSDRALAAAVRIGCTGNRLIYSSLDYAAHRQPNRFTWRLATELVRFSLLDLHTHLAELHDRFPDRFASDGRVYERLLKLSQAQDERALLWHGFLLTDQLRDILGASFRLLNALAAHADLLGEGGPEDVDEIEQPESLRIEIASPSASVGSATHLGRLLLHEIAALGPPLASAEPEETPPRPLASISAPAMETYTAPEAPGQASAEPEEIPSNPSAPVAAPEPESVAPPEAWEQDLQAERQPTGTAPGKRIRVEDKFVFIGEKAIPRRKPVEGIRVRRHPSIELAGEVRPDNDVTLTIDLAIAPDSRTESEGLEIDAPAGWTELPIQAQISAPDLHFDPGQETGTIFIRNGETSKPYCVQAIVGSGLIQQCAIEVRVTFYYEGRYCGSARRAFPVLQGARLAPSLVAPAATEGQGAAENAPGSAPEPVADDTLEKVLGMELPGQSVVPESRREPAPARYTAGAMMADTAAEPPKLTIQIFCDGRGKQNWHLNVSDKVKAECKLPAKLYDVISLKRNGKPLDEPAYVTDLFRAFEAQAPGQHMTFFQGIGEELYKLTPSCFREVYRIMFAKYGSFPIQILSDDPYMPWELMRPTRPGDDSQQPQADILGQRHPLGRLFPDVEGLFFPRLKRGKVATIAPDYSKRSLKRLKPLLSAQTDSKAILTTLKSDAVPIAGRKLEVIELFEDADKADIALVHYAGHGMSKTKRACFAELLLEDTDLLVPDISRQETQLGNNRHPLVFFNACQVGRSGLNLGVIGGFAEALAQKEFGGFIAPLWSVYDVDASTVTQHFLEAILPLPHGGQQTFAAALQRIRTEFGEQSPTFLSYVYYGDVMAKFV